MADLKVHTCGCIDECDCPPPSPSETPAPEGSKGAESECYMRHLDDVNQIRANLAGIAPPPLVLSTPASPASPVSPPSENAPSEGGKETT